MNGSQPHSAETKAVERAGLPLVTIITPTSNRADSLEETLRSVLGQDYPRLDYIVLDDGSTDDTRRILDRYAERYADRFRWESHDNTGLADTVNRGFSMARGDLIGLVNADDPLLPGALAPLVAALCAEPEIVVAYPDVEVIDDEGASLARYKTLDYSYADMVRWHDCLPLAGALFRRRVIGQVGGWDPSFQLVADYDFFLRVGLLGSFRRVPLTLATWRHRPSTAIDRRRGEDAAREQVRVIEKLYARDDLPEEVRAVRAEAFRNAYIVAGLLIDGGDRPDERFQLVDYLPELHFDLERRKLPTSRSPQAIIEWLYREVAERDKGTEWLRSVVVEKDKAIEWLKYEAAEREKTIAWLQSASVEHQQAIEWLRGVVAGNEKTIDWLHYEAAERDKTIAWLRDAVTEREKAIERTRSELSAAEYQYPDFHEGGAEPSTGAAEDS